MQIETATANDKEEILKLYKAQIGREYCPWTEDYPDGETIEFDLGRDSLFVLKDGNRIVGAVSIDDDEEVAKLACWNQNLAPGGEFARIAVLPEYQNRGLARQMVRFVMEVLKKRGYKSIHFLVNRHNLKAIRSYAAFGFDVVGECHMFEQDFLCYEKEL